jgi:uncharacterized protein YciI
MTDADTHKYLVLAICTARFDASVIEPHQCFLDDLRLQGRLELTGPFTDKSGGACLLRARSPAEANAIVARDALVTAGASQVSVYEWAATT